MKKLPIIIISGPPCTGKTTLAEKLATIYHLPYLSKDDIKEIIFDSLGWSDRKWSRKVGLLSYNLVYYFGKKLLPVRKTFIMESNFKPGYHNIRIHKIFSDLRFYPIQIFCHDDTESIIKKFTYRAGAGQRHPGHVEHLMAEELRQALKHGVYKPLQIGGTVINAEAKQCHSPDILPLLKSIEKELPFKFKLIRIFSNLFRKEY